MQKILMLLLTFSYLVGLANIPGLIPYRKIDKWGYCNQEKKIIIECKYEAVRPFNEGRAAVNANGKWMFIDNKGHVISNTYDDVQDFLYSRAPVKFNSQWGVIDRSGNEVVVPMYRYIGKFFDGRSWVMNDNGHVGVIDCNGKLVTQIQYNFFDEYENGVALAATWGDTSQYEFINRKGQITRLPGYQYVQGLSDGLSVVRRDSLAGYINKRGKLIIPIIYTEAFFFREDKAYVKQGEHSLIINKKGKWLFRINYEVDRAAAVYSCNRLAVHDSSKWGYLNENGEEIIELKYDFTNTFKRGIAAVKLNGKWGFINKNGKQISAFIYDEHIINNFWVAEDIGYYFHDNLCLVKLNGREGYLDIRGTEYWEN